ncbi:MAG TPA: tetratricopeptide repeat protein, partial [Arachidicoccus sp.]|nr:tetratricopeptide repeat protein [Arachidicoccus sp.]
MSRWCKLIIYCMLLIASGLTADAQPGTTVNLKNEKPADFARKRLRAEKTSYGPLGKIQELMQNTFTHFNYLYNANKRMTEVVTEATVNNNEDYSTLLPFYPYDENALAKNAFLDSVIEHATAGLLLHDLRNKYVDELYFLLGKAYYYQQKFDTAHQIFQYLNYAFAPKDEGYDLPIGSNISKSKGVFTIINPEKNGKSNSYAASQRRNDALIWQIKNYLQQKDAVQSAVLLDYLQKDSLLPSRLKPLLYETRAFMFYQQKKYDSAAINLTKTKYDLYGRTTRARQYYLTGQLFALAGDSTAAAKYFGEAKSQSSDPLLSIYGALAAASMQGNAPKNEAGARETHLQLLEKLAKREKYNRYKDVIYYAQAAIARDQGQLDEARKYLLTSIKAGRKIQPPNQGQKSKSFFVLATIDYEQGRYYEAAHHYDSINAGDLNKAQDRQLLQVRKNPLDLIASSIDSIKAQDSLQHLALLPEKERYIILKEKAKEIRKAISQREQKKEGPWINPAIQRPQITELFPSGSASGVPWYFNNPALKGSGFNLFRQKFGNRPNVDNWQRLSAISGQPASKSTQPAESSVFNSFNPDGTLKLDSALITPEDLLKGLPTTPKALAASSQIMATHLFKTGELLQNGLENFSGALAVYDSLIQKYPTTDLLPATFYNQYVCWILLGNKEKGLVVKNILRQRFADSKWNKILQNGAPTTPEIAISSLKDSGTMLYDQVYQLFVEGNFEAAYALKATADKQYGQYYWTPQLLYIEAVYNVTKRKDSVAINRLDYLISHFTQSPIRALAVNMLRILKRRTEIETYLRNLKISPINQWQNNRLARLENAARILDAQRERRIGLLKNQHILETIDTTLTVQGLHGELTTGERELALKKAQMAGEIAQPPVQPINGVPEPLLQAPLAGSIPIQDSMQNKIAAAKNKPVHVPSNPDDERIPDLAPNQQTEKPLIDSSEVNKLAQKAIMPSSNIQKELPKEVLAPGTINGFSFEPAKPAYVAIVLLKVAPVFASEAANAFNRY